MWKGCKMQWIHNWEVREAFILDVDQRLVLYMLKAFRDGDLALAGESIATLLWTNYMGHMLEVQKDCAQPPGTNSSAAVAQGRILS